MYRFVTRKILKFLKGFKCTERSITNLTRFCKKIKEKKYTKKQYLPNTTIQKQLQQK